MTIKQEILQLMKEKGIELYEIISSEKSKIRKNTIEYFEDLSKGMAVSIEIQKSFDSFEKDVYYYTSDILFKNILTIEEVIKLNEEYINTFLYKNNIKGKETELVKQEVFKSFSLFFYERYYPGKLYWMPIDTQLLEELLNKEGLGYDKSTSDSDIVTPNFYPIIIQQKKDLKDNGLVKQRKKKRY